MKAILYSLAFLPLLAEAGSTIDLSVTGKITPGACEPSLSNGGEYDLGKIAANGLNVDQPTPLAAHNLQMTIRCAALTLVALKPSDNRPGSHFDSHNSVSYGLGLVNGNEKVGSMRLLLQSVFADGAQVHPIGTSGSGWAPSSVLSPAFLTAFTPVKSELYPAPIQHLSADVQITPRIAPANTLTLTQEVPLDGSATLEINYL